MTTTPDPRRVPEAAVLIAVVLVAGPLVFLLAVEPGALLDPAFSLAAVAAAAAVAYPFCWWAIRHDPDPTTVFVPRAVGAAGAVAAAVCALLGVAGGGLARGAVAAAVVGVPPLSYALPRLPSPPGRGPVLAGAAAGGALALLAGVAAGSVLAGGLAAAFLTGAAGRFVGRADRSPPVNPVVVAAALAPAVLATVAAAVGALPAPPPTVAAAAAAPGLAYLLGRTL